MKWDGHIHTEYCPHGQVQDVELLIRRAIDLGFHACSLTEHAPLPPQLMQEQAGGDPEIWTTSSMSLSDVPHYLRRMTALKRKYAGEIILHVGFELDYFHDYASWTKDFLAEYGSATDDSILSVHFMPAKDGLRSIDYSWPDFKDGILNSYTSFQQVQHAYYELIWQSIQADLGPYKPKRLGHISLCRKFRLAVSETTDLLPKTQTLIKQLLNTAYEEKYSIDLNTSGLFKEYCQETYPPPSLLQQIKRLNIPLVYGSDSHSLTDIGRGYAAAALCMEEF